MGMPQCTLCIAPLRALFNLGLVIVAWAAAGPVAAGEEMVRVTRANYKQAFHFSPEFLRPFTYDVAVTPNWIGKTDTFWYGYRTSKATNYWRVDCRQATKVPLFDAVKLATLLSQATEKPLDAAQLPLTRMTIDDGGTKLKFVVENTQYEYDLQGEKLSKLGPAPPPCPRALAVGVGAAISSSGFKNSNNSRISNNNMISSGVAEDSAASHRGPAGAPRIIAPSLQTGKPRCLCETPISACWIPLPGPAAAF